MTLGSLIDRVIEPFAPSWALRRAVSRQQAVNLSAYAASDRGRRNKDWPTRQYSADAAVIPDAPTINARSRQLIRDSWVAKSAIRSASRNVVGCGIIPVPVAKGPDGLELKKLNRGAEEDFWRWANSSECDVEGRQTFWEKQQLAAEERFACGEHFIVFSYQFRPDRVGLKLQSFEPEQLNPNILSFQGNEVRGGIEVDEQGAPVAYHFYKRNPNDYLGRGSWESVRVPRERVFHHFRQERVRQTRGITPLAPVLQRIRDFHRRDDAEMWAAIMEACIGMVITQAGAASGSFQTLAPEPGDTGTTASGMRTIDFVPGMTPVLNPGESVTPFSPTRPGGTYEPYTRVNLRGIAAGAGLSYEQIARDFSQGTYSSQRQGMLEDWREWAQEQQLLVHNFIMPLYELWYRIAALEGRFVPYGLTFNQFVSNPHRYFEAEYTPDGHEWIDPLKEVQAYNMALQLKLKTRKDIISASGGRLRRTFEQYADEVRQAEELGIFLPDAQAPAAPTSTNAAANDAKEEDGATGSDAETPNENQAEGGQEEPSAPADEPSTPEPQPDPVPGTPAAPNLPPVSGPTSSKINPPPLQQGETPFDRQSARDGR